LQANAICYNAVVNACAQEGNVERARHWIEAMTAKGVEPTVNSFSPIVDMLAKKGDIDAAVSWLKLME
jgi:pentatricopeptide repeat protein